MFDLRGKTALVTGASGGIGWAVAKVLALRGARVGLSGRREAMLGSLASEIVSAGGRAETFPADLRMEADIHPPASRTSAHFDGVFFAKHGLSGGRRRSRGCLICEERRLWLRARPEGLAGLWRRFWRCVAWGWVFPGSRGHAWVSGLGDRLCRRSGGGGGPADGGRYPSAGIAHVGAFRRCFLCEARFVGRKTEVERMFDLRGKTALVTGASGGIGWAVAKVLALRGVHGWVFPGSRGHAWVSGLGDRLCRRSGGGGGPADGGRYPSAGIAHVGAFRRCFLCEARSVGRKTEVERMFDLRGKTALVTGASGGIGWAVAKVLALRGARVGLSGRREAMLGSLASEIVSAGGRAETFPADLRMEADIHALASRTLEQFGSLDILVNNAGITRDGLAMRMRTADWQEVLQMNLSAPFHLTQSFLPGMLRRRCGRIVFITSIVGAMGNAGQSNYAASKSGLGGLVKSLAREVGSRSVTVNALAPGFIDTKMTERLSSSVREKFLQAIPVGRFGDVMDVAHGVLYLASTEAGYVTGQTLHINGGLLMP